MRSRKPVTPAQAGLLLAYVAMAVTWRAAIDARNIYRWARRR